MQQESKCQNLTLLFQQLPTKQRAFDQAFEEESFSEAKAFKQEIISIITEIERLAWPYENLAREIIEKQYQEQFGALKEVGILQALSSGELGFVDINGRERPVPSLKRVYKYLNDKSNPEFIELLKRKEQQGFVKLRVTPFAMDLRKIINLVSEKVSKVGGANDSILSNSWQGDLSQLRYFINLGLDDQIDQQSGATKDEMLADESKYSFLLDGCIISLVEEGDDLPVLSNEAPPIIGGRTKIKCGKTAIGYLKDFRDQNSVYFGETSITPEEWLCLFAEKLVEKYIKQGRRIEWEGSDVLDTVSDSWFINCCFSSDRLLYGYWHSADRSLSLRDVDPRSQIPVMGVRPAARKQTRTH